MGTYFTDIAADADKIAATWNDPLDELDTAIERVLGSGTSFPGSPAEGDRFYRTDEDKLYVYDGSAWEYIPAGDDSITEAEIADKAIGYDQLGYRFVLQSCSNALLNLSGSSDRCYGGTFNRGTAGNRAYIAGAPSGQIITYDDGASGDVASEDMLAPYIFLRNITRGQERRITARDKSANTITVAGDISTWADNDEITTRVASVPASTDDRWFSLDIDQFMADNYSLAAGKTKALALYVSFMDESAGADGLVAIHPYETYASSKNMYVMAQVAGKWIYKSILVPVVSGRIAMWLYNASGGPLSCTLYVVGYVEED